MNNTKSQISETKYALEALLAEFGETLPVRFIDRMLRIGEPYTAIAVVNGIYYFGKSLIYDDIESIVYHSGHGSSVDEIKAEMVWTIKEVSLCMDVKE